ncbi:MAG: DNA polymerase III subunit gamma/tau [Verrucomicrobiota bacterium]
MSYEVFARKYRPQTFDDLVGQAHVSQTLKNAVAQNRLAHAYLFVGPRGIGKTSTARILAKALNCVKGPTVTPCGVCDNCREITAGNSLDVLEVDGASNNKVEEVRTLTDNVRYAPSKSRFKIYIIDEVHMLTSAAFNALLKTLEEPPPHVKFIFATTEPQKVLPTIVSRCQRFDLHRIPANLIAQHLQFIAGKEKITLEPAAGHAIARGAEGGLRDAESMLDQLVAFCGDKIGEKDVLSVFGFTSEQTVIDLTGRILGGEAPAALDVIYNEGEAGKDMMRLMSDLIVYLRDLLIFKAKPDALKEDVDPDVQKALAAHADLINTDRLLELIDQFAEAEARMKWVPNKKLHFEVAIIKAIQSLGHATLDDVIEKLGNLRDGKAVAGGVSPAPRHPAADTAASTRPTARVAEAPPEYAASKPAADVDPAEVWKQVGAKIPAQKGFLRNAAGAAHLIGMEGRNFLLGFSASDKSLMEILGTQANRKFIETALNEITGKDLTVKLSVDDKLPSKPVSPMPVATSGPGNFKDDPLIQEAIEMFKGEIKT